MATTRAKFICNAIETTFGGDRYELDDQGVHRRVEPREIVTHPRVKLSPVHAPDDDGHENHKFWSASPTGEMWLQINNPAGAEVFEVGQYYYVDFTPAPAK